jgi:hypothetical protein
MRVLLAATLLFWSVPAAAQMDSAGVGEARQLFDAGVAAVQRQAYADALDLFQRSAALAPRPVTTFNIGMCQRALADLPAAYETMRAYLASAADEPADRRAEASRVVLEIDSVLAAVTVRVDQAGAEVVVDGRSMGTSPVREPVRLLAGTHVFEARKEGFATTREVIEVVSGEALDVELTLTVAGEEPVVPGDGEVEGGIETKWWFWTIIGAVVVGGAVTAGVLLAPEEAPAADWWVQFD